MSSDFHFDEKQLEEYSGTYYNKELNISYKLVKEKQQLFLRIGNRPKEVIDLLRKDNLIMADGTAQFLRDPNGKITAFSFSSGDVKNLSFKKL